MELLRCAFEPTPDASKRPNGIVVQAPVVQEQDTPIPSGRWRFNSDPGAPRTFSLKEIGLKPISYQVVKTLLERHHYLHSVSGGTLLLFGAFIGNRLLGAIQFSRGSAQAHKLVEGAAMADCATLARLWLSDELPKNSESRVLGIALRALKRHTSVRFLISYADPSQHHLGIIYQATNWLYTGLSGATPLFDLGDGIARHSRSISIRFGSHSLAHFQSRGVAIKKVPQSAKHRYVFFLDPAWRDRLLLPVLPYPKEVANEHS